MVTHNLQVHRSWSQYTDEKGCSSWPLLLTSYRRHQMMNVIENAENRQSRKLSDTEDRRLS